MTDDLVTRPDEILELTPLDEWRVQTWLAKLPSGRVVRLRKLNFLDMVQRGDIPNSLIPAVRRMLELDKDEDTKPAEQTPLADLQEKLGLAAWAARGALVHPRLWDGQDKCPQGAVPIETMTQEDLLAVAAWAMGDWAPLQESPFRSIRPE